MRSRKQRTLHVHLICTCSQGTHPLNGEDNARKPLHCSLGVVIFQTPTLTFWIFKLFLNPSRFWQIGRPPLQTIPFDSTTKKSDLSC